MSAAQFFRRQQREKAAKGKSDAELNAKLNPSGSDDTVTRGLKAELEGIQTEFDALGGNVTKFGELRGNSAGSRTDRQLFERSSSELRNTIKGAGPQGELFNRALDLFGRASDQASKLKSKESGFGSFAEVVEGSSKILDAFGTGLQGLSTTGRASPGLSRKVADQLQLERDAGVKKTKKRISRSIESRRNVQLAASTGFTGTSLKKRANTLLLPPSSSRSGRLT